MKNIVDRKFFKSKIFKGLFFSYVIIIVALFGVYTGILYYEMRTVDEERREQYYASGIDKMSNAADAFIMDAMVVASNIDASKAINKYAMANKGIVPDTGLESQVQEEINSYIVSRYNVEMYDAVVFFDGGTKAVSSVGTYYAEIPADFPRSEKIYVNTSLNDLFSLNNSEILFNKKFLIYAQEYSSAYAEGVICVLFDSGCMSSLLNEILEEYGNVQVFIGDECLYSRGDIKEGVWYETKSSLEPDLTYRMLADKNNFAVRIDSRFVISVSIAGVLCVVFIFAALYEAGKFYRPVDSIGDIIYGDKASGSFGSDRGAGLSENSGLNEASADGAKRSWNELETIAREIENLIGEKNGYKEHLISIKPYVQQGMFHEMLSGSSKTGRVRTMLADEYKVLQKPYYIIGDINIAYVGGKTAESSEYEKIHNLIEAIFAELSDEETSIMPYDRDDSDVFAIINSDVTEGLENLYYEIFERLVKRIGSSEYAVTVGVDRVRDDISQLGEACTNAVCALNMMVTGGRNAVYFYGDEKAEHSNLYYFPQDTEQRLTRLVKENNISEINKILDDIMSVNMKKYSDNIEVIGMMLDELHITAAKVLKNIQQGNVVEFNLEKMSRMATIEEIFGYYKAVFETAGCEYKKFRESKADIGKLNSDIIDEINANYTDKDMSLARLTDKFGVSNKYISVMIKKTLGMTYIQYVQELRIEHARMLMQENENYSLEDIAGMCGYTSMLTFRRNFKTVTGVKPSEYKKR